MRFRGLHREREKYLGSCILTLLKESYPYPLDLQWEDWSNQYNFLEMEVLTEEDRLWCRYQSKWRTAMESKDRAYVRVPNGKDGHSTLDRYRYLRNTIIRICDCCTYTTIGDKSSRIFCDEGFPFFSMTRADFSGLIWQAFQNCLGQ